MPQLLDVAIFHKTRRHLASSTFSTLLTYSLAHSRPPPLCPSLCLHIDTASCRFVVKENEQPIQMIKLVTLSSKPLNGVHVQNGRPN